jgi:hypothetical protein
MMKMKPFLYRYFAFFLTLAFLCTAVSCGTSPDGNTKFSEGDVLLPKLASASQWSAEFEITVPTEEDIIIVRIFRPTGSSVIERSYSAKGELIP